MTLSSAESIELSRKIGLTDVAEDLDFTNQTVVVTGAADGIGADVARALHHFGAHVIGIDVQDTKLKALETELGSRFTSLPFDLSQTDENAYETLGKQIASASPTGVIDAYLMNAGVVKMSDITVHNKVANTPISEYQKMLQINAISHAAIYKHIADYLSEDARLVVTSSPIVQRAAPETAAYSVSKQALEAFANNIMAELKGTDIKVVGYVPPPVQNFLRRDLKPKEPLHAHPHGTDIVELPLRLASRTLATEFNGKVIAMGYDHLRVKTTHDDGSAYDYLPRADDNGFAYDLRVRPIIKGGGDEGDDLVTGYSTQPMRDMMGLGKTPDMEADVLLETVYAVPDHIKKNRAPKP